MVNAFKRLDAKGLPIKGLMTWSVNWDNGVSKDNVAYNWEFSRRYGPLIHGQQLSSQEESTATPEVANQR